MPHTPGRSSRSIAVLVAATCLGLGACRKPDATSREQATSQTATAGVAARNAAFWKWFTEHSAEIATITTAEEPIADQLHEELKKVRSELTFEIGPKATPREIIVSADGIQRAFPAVQSLVAAAPSLPGWTVIAFRPRKPGFTIEMGDMKLTPTDVKFTSSPESTGKIAVTVWLAGLEPSNRKQLESASFILLDATLGEYDVETRLGSIEIKSIAEAGKRELRPLSELAAVVDAAKKTTK